MILVLLIDMLAVLTYLTFTLVRPRIMSPCTPVRTVAAKRPTPHDEFEAFIEIWESPNRHWLATAFYAEGQLKVNGN